MKFCIAFSGTHPSLPIADFVIEMQLSRDDIGPLDISMITNEMTEPDLPSIVILL